MVSGSSITPQLGKSPGTEPGARLPFGILRAQKGCVPVRRSTRNKGFRGRGNGAVVVAVVTSDKCAPAALQEAP